MRRHILMALALVSIGSARAEELQPIKTDVVLEDVVHFTFDFAMAFRLECDGNFCASVPEQIVTLATKKDPRMLGDYFARAVKAKYEEKKLNAGYYLGDPRPDDTLNNIEGIRMRVIVPSELFRDSAAEWDQFELLAAVQVVADPETTKDVGILWVLPQNYMRRSRGGINFGNGPSPDWQFSALSDLDAINGRLKAIQVGIKQQVDAFFQARAQPPGQSTSP